ncbi:MAG: hypothetical protein IPN24_11540 [Betaproteobacteria bacterium]|nr:hypothetical protein [Betaproteobacteria bacterium]
MYDAQVSVHEDLNGRVSRMHGSDIRSVAKAVAGEMKITRDGAEAIARAAIREPGADAPAGVAVRVARQVWYALADGELVLAWEILITAERPLLDYRVIVDRASGEVLVREDRLVGWVIGRGKVFRPNPIQASGDPYLTEASDAGYINSLTENGDLPGLAEGTGKLQGRFVDVSLPSIYLPQSGYPIADEPGRQYAYDVTDPRFAQVNAYYAIDSAQRYLRSLGFAGERTVPNGIRDFPTRAYPQWDSTDNSRFSPSADTLYFGEGGVPDAEDADIVVHEYGHAIQFFQNPAWGCLSGTAVRDAGDGRGVLRLSRRRRPRKSWQPRLPGRPRRVHRGVGQHRLHQPDSAVHLSTLSAASGRQQGLSDRPGRRDIRRWPDLVGRVVGYPERDRRQRCDADRSRAPILAPEGCDHAAGRAGNGRRRRRSVRRLQRDSLAPGLLCPRHPGRGRLRAADQHDDPPACNQGHVGSPIQPDPKRGQSPWLRLKGGVGTTTRLVLGFDLSGINLGDVKSAILEMTIAGTDQQWDVFGRTIEAHALVADFDEGNGTDRCGPIADDTGNRIGRHLAVSERCGHLQQPDGVRVFVGWWKRAGYAVSARYADAAGSADERHGERSAALDRHRRRQGWAQPLGGEEDLRRQARARTSIPGKERWPWTPTMRRVVGRGSSSR